MLVTKQNSYHQISLFDTTDVVGQLCLSNDSLQRNEVILDAIIINRFKNYNFQEYEKDIKYLGLELTWDYICEFILNYKNSNAFLDIDTFSELYEIGLAIENKDSKKKKGQYYTPTDVAKLMSNWCMECEGYNICDVGCGTGELILNYLKLIGYEKAKRILEEGRVYLYDVDRIALKICQTVIAVKFGIEVAQKLNIFHGDFLDNNIHLPDNAKVISNPPYASISIFEMNWAHTDVLKQTKEFYAAFMEKVFLQAKSAVFISPFSFVSGNKFYSLRRLMCEKGNGFILSFDNVPGNIFCGRKKGVFNTNTSNSVRAAITVFNSDVNKKGFKISHLIRFKNKEREQLLQNKYLEGLLPFEYQIVDEVNPSFKKIDYRLSRVYKAWMDSSDSTLKSLTSSNGKYTISMPNTCRYYTTASSETLNRTGQIFLNFEDEDKFNFAFCLINSSFAYWYWRIFDGAITFSKSLLNDMPVFFNLLNKDDKVFFSNIVKEMIEKSKEFIIKKNNVGIQENIKYPKKYREKINKRMLQILNLPQDTNVFDVVHSNEAMEVHV